MQISKRGKLFKFIIPFLVVAGILFYFANRYLIDHVEIDNASSLQKTAQASQDTGESSNFSNVAADDWNYESDGTSITVKEVTTGSGEGKVTYFAADIKLSEAEDLCSAFAQNEFGRNITEDTSDIAEDNSAVFAVNGDYYGFRDDGILIRNGVIYRYEPARTGLAIYKDGSMKVYDETETSAQELLEDGVWNTLSFGPALLVDSQVPSGIEEVEIDTNFGNHSIQGSHPRTGIGMIDKNHFVVVVVDGRSPGYSKGVTLSELADIFKDLGCTEAYNLDGGGSSTMYFNGRVVNNPQGKDKERGVSDILYIAR
jgi:exopolysaccharide biosynthesis protein